MQRWADISYGSIYPRLRRMVDEGMAEVVRTEQEGNRPSRTVYGITDAGRQELARSLAEALTDPVLASQPVDVALSFCVTDAARLGSVALRALLAERVDRLAASEEELRRAPRDPVSDQPGVGALVEDLLGHSLARVRAEIEWTERVVERLERGDYHAPPEGPVDALMDRSLVSPGAES